MSIEATGSGVPPWLINSNSSTANTEKTGTEQAIMGKDAFLKILLTQLRYQNPLEPVKDTDFIAQMAQFSSLEQMQNMNKNLEAALQTLSLWQENSFRNSQISCALDLVGREIEYRSGEEYKTGTVEAIRVNGGIPRLVVNDEEVYLEMVAGIKQAEIQAEIKEGATEDEQSDSLPTTDPTDPTEAA
jgi:flagellar basal-body rod modification protein FlgD